MAKKRKWLLVVVVKEEATTQKGAMKALLTKLKPLLGDEEYKVMPISVPDEMQAALTFEVPKEEP